MPRPRRRSCWPTSGRGQREGCRRGRGRYEGRSSKVRSTPRRRNVSTRCACLGVDLRKSIGEVGHALAIQPRPHHADIVLDERGEIGGRLLHHPIEQPKNGGNLVHLMASASGTAGRAAQMAGVNPKAAPTVRTSVAPGNSHIAVSRTRVAPRLVRLLRNSRAPDGPQANEADGREATASNAIALR